MLASKREISVLTGRHGSSGEPRAKASWPPRVRFTTIDPTPHAQWCEVVIADLACDGAIQAFHNSRMLRYNDVRLMQNLLRQGWCQVPPQW